MRGSGSHLAISRLKTMRYPIDTDRTLGPRISLFYRVSSILQTSYLHLIVDTSRVVYADIKTRVIGRFGKAASGSLRSVVMNIRSKISLRDVYFSSKS